MSVLVTGGAGYIGSHVAHALLDNGETVFVLDNLTSGALSLVPKYATFYEGDAGDRELVQKIIAKNGVKAVMHFAGSTVVPDSVVNPLKYYRNNSCVSQRLFTDCVAGGVEHLIFSSTAAVYGPTDGGRVIESGITDPLNPYGRSKLVTEWILRDVCDAHNISAIALRYFNVAGADPQGRTGQSTPKATHLIKRACQVALGKVPSLEIFGTDYPTPDGSGIRDYIHVTDLVEAHLLALAALRKGMKFDVFNCGYGHGVSVWEIVAAVESVINAKLSVSIGPRRLGDPAVVIADSQKIKDALHWQPRYDCLQTIVSSALEWERRAKEI